MSKRDRARVAHLRDVADAAQDPVRDPRRAARAPRDLVGRRVLDRDVEDPRGAAHDGRELVCLVVAEAEGHPEAVAQGRGQKTGPRRRADERERRKIERQRAGRRALADDDVEPEVLERRIEDLLDRVVQPVDLVDEQDVARLEAREDRRHVALPLERWAGHCPQPDLELLADDRRERRLAEARRPDEEDVVERLASRPRGLERDLELLLRPLLPDELVEAAGAQRALDVLLALLERRRQERRAHAAARRAMRTRSSAGSSGSTSARTRSASIML